MNPEFNIIIGSLEPTDKDLFFGPLDVNNPNDQFIEMPVELLWSHLLVQIGIFPSMGQAKKNNWHKPIENGFSDVVIGKLKTRICILKI